MTKRFEGIRALEDVSFAVQPGEVHALLGENGAGKSTIVKIVTGLLTADSGELHLDGREVRFATPMAARADGVVAVYQDPKLFPHLDVAENIFMGLHPRSRFGTIDRRRMYERAAGLLAELIRPSTRGRSRPDSRSARCSSSRSPAPWREASTAC